MKKQLKKNNLARRRKKWNITKSMNKLKQTFKN